MQNKIFKCSLVFMLFFSAGTSNAGIIFGGEGKERREELTKYLVDNCRYDNIDKKEELVEIFEEVGPDAVVEYLLDKCSFEDLWKKFYIFDAGKDDYFAVSNIKTGVFKIDFLLSILNQEQKESLIKCCCIDKKCFSRKFEDKSEDKPEEKIDYPDDSRDIVFWSIKSSSLCYALIEEIGDNKDFLEGLMRDACRKKDTDIIKYLAEKKNIKINWCDVCYFFAMEKKRNGYFLAECEAKKCVSNLVKYFIENNIFDINELINIIDKDESFIRCALATNDEDLLRYLIENGVDTNCKNKLDFLKLYFSLCRNKSNLRIVKCLVDNGVAIDKNMDYDGECRLKKGDFSFNQYLRRVDIKREGLENKVKDLMGDFEKIENGQNLNVDKKILEIKGLFEDKEVPLCTKQACLVDLLKLHKARPNLITREDMKFFYSEIEFNFKFIKNSLFDAAKKFALTNKFVDMFGKSVIVTEEYICVRDKELAKNFQTVDALKKSRLFA
jgi:hypothetical protein